MPIVNKTALEIKRVTEKLKKIEQSLSEVNVKDTRIVYKKAIISSIKKLCSCVIELRSILLSIIISPKETQEAFDNDISEIININFDLMEFDDFTVYEITIPVIIPKTKSLISKSIWNSSFKVAYKRLCENQKDVIERIESPIVIFENQFINQNQGNGLKDTDNYEISDILNMLQYYFIADDSTATTIVRNITGACENRTKIYIVSEKNFRDWILNF